MASKESRWASAICRAVRAVLSMLAVVATSLPPWQIVSPCYYVLTTHISVVNLGALVPSFLPLFTGGRGREILRRSAVGRSSQKPVPTVVVLSWGWLIRQ